jgi:hypothetical protein
MGNSAIELNLNSINPSFSRIAREIHIFHVRMSFTEPFHEIAENIDVMRIGLKGLRILPSI